MTVFDTILINLHKGFEKFKYGASIFSERAKVEVNIVRIRLRIDSITARLSELHRTIGAKVVELKRKAALPKTVEQLLENDEISMALEELAKREKELEELNAQLAGERAAYKADLMESGEDGI